MASTEEGSDISICVSGLLEESSDDALTLCPAWPDGGGRPGGAGGRTGVTLVVVVGAEMPREPPTPGARGTGRRSPTPTPAASWEDALPFARALRGLNISSGQMPLSLSLYLSRAAADASHERRVRAVR